MWPLTIMFYDEGNWNQGRCPGSFELLLLSLFYTYITFSYYYLWLAYWGLLGFSGGSDVRNLPAMEETWVWSLDQEDPLEKGMATHTSILAWKVPWTEEPGGLQSMGYKESDRSEWLIHTHSLSHVLHSLISYSKLREWTLLLLF